MNFNMHPFSFCSHCLFSAHLFHLKLDSFKPKRTKMIADGVPWTVGGWGIDKQHIVQPFLCIFFLLL